MKKLLRAAQILLLPLHLLASNQIFEAGSMVRLANPSAGIYDVYWLFDSSNHYFGHYPPQALPVSYDSYFEVGSYTLNSLGNNEVSAELNSAAHATLGDTGGTGSASRTATVTLTSPFSADYSGTRTEISGVIESFNGNLTIYPVQDYAPEVLPTGSVWDSDNAYYQSVAYSGPASGGRITILSSNSLQKYDPEYDQTSTGSYTYTKLGPNLGRVSISDPANYYTANINLFFRSPTEVYFYGNTTDYYGSYTDWGALAATYPSSYSPPAIFPAPSALPQDQILQITGTNSDLSLNLAGGTWTDVSGGSGSFTHTYAVQSGGVAGLTLNRSGQNAPNNAEHFALRFTDDGVGEVVYSSLDGSQSFNLVDAPTWELYDDFSGSTIDTQNWDFSYWDGGNLPTPSNGRALLSGNTVINWNATQVTEAMLQANGNAANLVSGGEAHSILEFKDSDSILGIEMELTLPVGVSDNVGIGLYAIDYDVMFNSPNQDPVIFDLDLWNSSTFSLPEVQITWKDPVSGTEQKANGVPVAAGQTVLLKFERTEDTIRFFVNDTQVAESGYSSGNETFMIRAVSEDGYSFLAYVDNVRVLRDTPPVDPSADTDGDGLYDSVETNTGVYLSTSDTGTNPNNADTDGDGVNDGDEVSNGTDPNEAPGPQLPSIESKGNTYLLEYSSGYFARSIYSGSANTPLIYQGRQVSPTYPFAAFTALGVDLVNGTYRLVWSYGSQYYAANFSQSGSSISALTAVSDILTEEVNLQQDLNGDGHVGPPIDPPGPVGNSYVLTALTGELKSVPDQVSFTADTISFGFSGNLLESDSYSYSDGTVIYDTEEVIKFTYTSATGGTYEEGYDEGDGFSVENTGTFEEANVNLSLQTNWQRSETMDSPVSTQYWQIGATSGDSVAYNDGELNFIFDSGSVDSAGPSDDQAIEISYAGALPLDEDWQIVVDDTYVSDSADGFIMAYQLGSEGSVDYEFGLGAGRSIYFDVYGGPAGPAFYSLADVSTGPGILTGLNFRIQHLASTRELIFEYQTEGASASEWTEVARINLSTGAASGLSGSGSLTGQLPSSSENLFFGVEIIQYSTVAAIPMENIEIGGIEIGTYTPPIEPLDSIAGMQFEYTSIDNVNSVPSQEFYGSDDLAAYGFSNSIIERFPYTYADGVISFPQWSEEIRLTFTDANSGTYAFVELYGGAVPVGGGELDDSGTFAVVTPSLVEKTDWQHNETFDSGFSTDYWNIFHDTEDRVEVANGALNFIFAGAGEGVPEPDPTLYYEDYEIDIDYGRTLPMDESWQIVMDEVYAKTSLDDFEFEIELEFEGQGYNFQCGFEFESSYLVEDSGSIIDVSFYSTTPSFNINGLASVSTVEDSRIQSNVSLRITHNADNRELVFEYQPGDAIEWSELARLNLGSGDFSGLNSTANQGNGELLSTSQRMAVSLEVETDETTQVGDLNIGGIEIGNYTPPPPPASPESLVGYKLVGQFTEGLASVYRNDFFFTGAATLQGHYGVESNDPSIVDDWSEETYTYQKTGAITGTVAITNSTGETTDVALIFDSATSGTAISNGRNGNRPNSASGPFTFVQYDPSELPDADTDGDGLYDSVETNTGVYLSTSDTGTNPNNADTDGDGVNDGDEVSNGTDPNEAPGPQLPSIESKGNTYLLEYSSGYFARSIYSGSANTPLIYQGRQVSPTYPFAAFTALGVDLVNGTYRLVWSYGSQYYAMNFSQSGSSISALTAVSDILTEEVNLQQDLNGDGHVGPLVAGPPASIAGLELNHGGGVLYFEPQGAYYGGAQNGHINNKGSWEYSVSSYKGIIILDDLTDTLEDTRLEIDLRFSSPTAGSFEVFERGDALEEQPRDSGNFTLGARTLLDSVHPDWQYREDFEGASIDGALWSPYTDSGRDEVAVADGLLSVLIDSQSLESDTWAGLDSLRVLPMSESWEVQTRVVAGVNRLAGVNNYEIGILLSNYDGVGSGGFQIHLEDWGLSAGVINRTSPWDAFRYAHTNALPGLASAHLRIVHDSSASVVSLAYDVDGITNGWNWEPLIEYQLSDGSGTRWIDGIPEPFSGGTWTLGQDDYLRVDLEAHVSATNGAYNAQAGDLGFDSFEIDSYTPPVIPVDSDGDGLDDSVETNTGVYVSTSDTGTSPNNRDSSGDGLFDGAVVSAGFNPNVDYSSLIAIVPNSTVDMNLRSLRLERAENGAFNMNFDLEMSTDLETWAPHTSHSLELTVPDQSKTFMRLNVK